MEVDDIYSIISQYENDSGFKLWIEKSDRNKAYLYICKSHYNCNFRIKFGKHRNMEGLRYKHNFSNLFHTISLSECAFGKRGPYSRYRHKVLPCVNVLKRVKYGKPSAKDIQKTTANLQNTRLTYSQSYHFMSYYHMKTKEKMQKISF